MTQPDVAWLPLLITLGRLRCASIDHLQQLVLPGAPKHELTLALEAFFAEGLVQRLALPFGHHGYTLTARAVRGVPELRALFTVAVANVSTPAAAQGWQRAGLWAHYAKQGYLVGRNLAALAALRANRLQALNALDNQESLVLAESLQTQLENQLGNPIMRCPVCGAKASIPNGAHLLAQGEPCPGQFSLIDACAFDIAHKAGECVLLVADNPFKSILTQLEALPVRIARYAREARASVYLQALPVVFVPSDGESCWDKIKGMWSFRGPRLRLWLRYTEANRTHEDFPYWRVLKNVQPPAAAILNCKRSMRRSFAHGVSAC